MTVAVITTLLIYIYIYIERERYRKQFSALLSFITHGLGIQKETGRAETGISTTVSSRHFFGVCSDVSECVLLFLIEQLSFCGVYNVTTEIYLPCAAMPSFGQN